MTDFVSSIERIIANTADDLKKALELGEIELAAAFERDLKKFEAIRDEAVQSSDKAV